MGRSSSELRTHDAGQSHAGAALSRRQSLMWLEHELAPSAPRNVWISRFEVPAPLDPERFADAFEALVAETEALRTVIVPGSEAPAQVVLPSLPYRARFVDLSGDATPEAALDRFLALHAPEPLRMQARLFDCWLVHLAEERSVVLLKQHHIVTDAAAQELLWQRLGELYDRRPGSATRPFAEYLEREQLYLASSEAARDARFWKERLAGAPSPAPLYGREPRARSGMVRREVVPLGTARTAALRERLRDAPLATPMPELSRHLAYATAYFAYLARVTGQSRVAVGCPLANRRSRRLKQVVGLVMEQSPMMGEVRGDDTFASLHGRLAEDLASVLRHARFCSSNPGSRRVYDAVLNLHTVRWADLAGVPVRGSIAPAAAFAHAWPEGAPDAGEAISLTIWREPDTDVLAFDLDRDVFDETLARRVPSHFLRMLDAMIADPSARPADVDLLADDERAICAAPVPSTAERPPVTEMVRAQVERTPDRIAVRTASVELTYAALWARTAGVARALREAGLRRGECVAIALHRSERLPSALLGVLAAGGAYVPLDPAHPASRTAQLLEDARPRMLLTEPGVSIACELPRVDVTRAGEAEAAFEPIGPSDLAYVLFTSGSTGRPKGVEIEHRGLSAFLAAFAHTPGMDAEDRVLALATPGFDIHTLELLLPLCVGASSFVAQAGIGADGPRLRGIVEREGITIVQATPPTWRALVDAGWRGDGSVKALVGGEPLPPDLAEALLERTASLWNVYGPTESTVWATAHRVRRVESPAPVGRPIESAVVRVIDDAGLPVPIGVEGEIWIGGAGVGRGYRGREDLTRASFVSDREGHRFYRSGDRGRWREDGALVCLGRRDGQVKIRGLRVELGEIEAALREHPAVSDAAVLVSGAGADARVVAHVAGAVELEALRAHAASRLPAHMIPSRWRAHDALPLGATGKIDRKALAALETVAPQAARATPRDDLEAALAAIFAEALDLPSVGADEDFFELGGHSLLAARVVDRARAELGVRLPLGALFSARTVRALAERIGRGTTDAPACIPLRRVGQGIPLFCVCGVQVYSHLAERLAPRHAVFGVYLPVEEEVLREARAGRIAALDVESMARSYVELIRRHRPHGPYALAGLSFGGLLALEIGRQLRRAGEEVPVLALIDSVMPQGLRRAPLRWAAAHARSLVRSPRGAIERAMGATKPEATDEDISVLRERAYVAAMRRYRGGPYDGDVVLFRASDSFFGEGWTVRRDGGYSQLVPRLRIVDVPGSHTGVLAPPHVDALADGLRSLLSAPSAERRSG